MEKSTVSRNVMRMCDNGWLTVTQAEPGPGQVLKLSAKGRKLLERSVPLWNQAQERTTAMLGQNGALALHRAADTVIRIPLLVFLERHASLATQRPH